jgi:predicted RNase H-like HicB family nuclease
MEAQRQFEAVAFPGFVDVLTHSGMADAEVGAAEPLAPRPALSDTGADIEDKEAVMVCELAYRVVLTPDEIDGGFVVTFPDLPEAITQGEDLAGALEEAADALEEAIVGRIQRGEPIPRPSVIEGSQQQVFVRALTAARAALYLSRQK